ncbi:hypothetical protein WJX72_002007 [[Myrmecia] bisecta]|uniref:Uncharacterized protein n=1 Tax=[Myrmecia] bisecta TaxID=41462 RepID=A0AAW1R5S6_9CHLO
MARAQPDAASQSQDKGDAFVQQYRELMDRVEAGAQASSSGCSQDDENKADGSPAAKGGCGCGSGASAEARSAQQLMQQLEAGYASGEATGTITREQLREAFNSLPASDQESSGERFVDVAELLRGNPEDLVFADDADLDDMIV